MSASVLSAAGQLEHPSDVNNSNNVKLFELFMLYCASTNNDSIIIKVKANNPTMVLRFIFYLPDGTKSSTAEFMQ